jgi:spore cortex biosynthesis protein YabQ
MPDTVGSQFHVFLYSVAAGMLIAFIYDLFRIKRRAVKTGVVFVYLEDIAFWMIVAFIMLMVLHFTNEGEIRGYIFVAAILGAIMYLLLLSRLVMNVFLTILRFVCRALSFILNFLAWPVRFVLRILSVPARLIIRLSGKGIKTAGRKVKILVKDRLKIFKA